MRPRRQHCIEASCIDAECNAGGAAEQRGTLEARGVQRGVALFEHQPLLRVHRHRLGGRDAEPPMVETLGAAHEGAMSWSRGQLGVQNQGWQRPACRRHLANGVSARGCNVPRRNRGVGAAGQHDAHPDECHVCFGCGGSGLRALRWRRRGEKRGQASQ
eukprot:scaffold80720_cov71-Phaeocystis_antarctica.AAC.3